jgi:hypothetical protein
MEINKVKKLAFIIFALTLGACSAEEEVAAPKCNQECGGALANNPNSRCDLYAPDLYESGSVTCEANTAGQCVVNAAGCVSIPPVAEYAKCSGTGQGDCDEGFECVTIEPGLTACMEPCQPTDATACADGDTARTCVQLTQTAGYCFKHTAKLNESCYTENFSWCEDGQGFCRATKTNLVGEWLEGRGYEDYKDADYRCKPVCDVTGQDTSATICGGGDVCSAAPTRNIMGIESTGGGSSTSQDGSDYKECELEADPTTCSAGYECVKLTFTSGEEKNLCTMFEHWCGQNAQFCGNFSQAGFQACLQAGPCNVAPEYKLCNVVGADATLQDASVFCRGAYEINDQPLQMPVCIGFCEDDKVKNAEGTDLLALDCGTGYNCAAPPEGAEWSMTHQSVVDGTNNAQGEPDESITCEDDSTCLNAANGNARLGGDFNCLVHPSQDISTKHCFRPSKVCTPN